MQDQTLTQVNTMLTELAKKRRETILSDVEIKRHKKDYDELLIPLAYQSPNGTTFYGIQLPQSFPTMTGPDILTVLKWYVRAGSIIRPGNHLLEVHSNFGDIIIPLFPTLRGTYRVVRVLKAQGEQVQMGDLLIILQPIASQVRRRKTTKRKAA